MTMIKFIGSLIQTLTTPSFIFSSSPFCKFSLPLSFYFMLLLSFSSPSLCFFVSYLIHSPTLALTEVFSNSQVIRLGLAGCDSNGSLMSVRNEKFALGYQFHRSLRSFTKVHD